ncbi:Protein MON2-like protein [Golovinomyces cichoracearum]|uniref:Protein MON2-like protein n=1 Tax=Golovinomyces cichoracearum TaxID=62708 RepID=A0A420IA08_9PEZI|nr:Protein MON2-like protein [Golovinomyces cichoracearum]
MTAQILASELGNLIQECKRKHADLRTAAERSLDEVKALRLASEGQVASDLSQRPSFVTPFIIACSTKYIKYTGIAIICLQRLSVSRALPRTRLREVLDAFHEACNAGLEVQLKILQALPSLLQNYADDLKGDLVSTTLNICTVLQASKNGIVANTAAATLQQLVVTVFDTVVAEDKSGLDSPTVGEAPSDDGPIQLRAAALDAYRIFNDLCLLTESQKPLFLKSTGIPKTFGLELIESVLTNHSQIFIDHPEQASILRMRVMTFILNSLSEKLSFAVTVRATRILYTLLRFHLSILSSEGEIALGLLIYMLDHDTALWKRSLCMEVLKGLFSDAALIRRIYIMYDAQEDRKPILRDLVAAFVRVSTEKPSVIGLGPQSSVPWSNQDDNVENDHAILEATGVPGIIGSSINFTDPGVGISTQWSTLRVPCIDQLDKVEPPTVPGSYIYSLLLACVSGFSEGLAKFILPLTVPQRSTKSNLSQIKTRESGSSTSATEQKAKLERRISVRKNPVSINPLTLEDHPLFGEIKSCAGIVDKCWPAILATCSTFLYATLDAEYYRGLIRSFQKFAHVAGLLHLSTPRDAFLTALSKASIPLNLLTSNLSTSSLVPNPTMKSEKSSTFSNAKSLLNGENLASEKLRQTCSETMVTSLNTRNLLCIRALLNLGIALGPILDSAWAIVLGTVQHADLVILSSAKVRNHSINQKNESQSTEDLTLSVDYGVEVKAVQTAAIRLLESTVDFPNPSFLEVVTALCSLLGKDINCVQEENQSSQSISHVRRQSNSHPRANSVVISPKIQSEEDLFVLSKLHEISSLNIQRLILYPEDASGWRLITTELILVSGSSAASISVRRRAAEILIQLILEAATAAIASLPEAERSITQLCLLDTLKRAIEPLELNERETSMAIHFTDVEVHKIILDGLKSILEKCGETFVNGWDVAFTIIGSVFVKNGVYPQGNLKELNSTPKRSAKLIRSAFNSLQLICSDFLSSLPSYCYVILISTLHDFCSQDDDLNISLTTVTFFWDLSDFISRRIDSSMLNYDFMRRSEIQALTDVVGSKELEISDAASWMLLLLRLTAVTRDERLELRKSAIQTLLRILDAYGNQLSSEAWSICLESVVFKLLRNIVERLYLTNGDDSLDSDNDKKGWHETTVLALTGLTNLLADYLNVISEYSSFCRSWQTLLGNFDTFLHFQVLSIDTAVFNALREILARGNTVEGRLINFDANAIDFAWDLWSKSVPKSTYKISDKTLNNQKCLLAYTSVLQEIYRLIQSRLAVSHVQVMLTLLHTAVLYANAESYTADIENLTPLQTQILDLLKMIRTDIEGVPATLISQVAEFSELAFKPRNATRLQDKQPTYIALSKSSMILLENLIVKNSSNIGIYSTGAISTSLESLATPITLKYSFQITTKSLSPWRQATTCVLTILKSIFPYLTTFNLDNEVIQSLWKTIVNISNGITKADCQGIGDPASILLDEDSDIESFLTLRELITPELGSTKILDETRRVYTESLFHISLIHDPQIEDLPKSGNQILSTLFNPRKGKTVDPTPSARPQMSYVCFNELISLARVHDGSESRIKLAQAAAPYLMLRAGLTIQNYTADQPLRGMMPQPLMQRKELLYILRALVDLKFEPKAIPNFTLSSLKLAVVSQNEEKFHLRFLYHLLVNAVRAATRDQEVIACLALALERVELDISEITL